MDNEFLERAQLGEQDKAEKKKEKKKAAKKKVAKERKPNAFVQILNGDFFTREFMLNNLNFIFFIILLMILVVAKGYYGKQLSKDVTTTQEELKEAKSDYYEAKTRLEEETGSDRLKDELEPSGLKQTENPINVIRIKKNIFE